MAGDIVIRVRGDATQLASFYKATQKDTTAFVQSVKGTFDGYFNNILGGSLKTFRAQVGTTAKGVPIFKEWGTQGRVARFEIDQLNNVLKTTYESGLKLRNGRFLPVATTTRYTGDAKAFVDAIQRENEAMAKFSAASATYATKRDKILADTQKAQTKVGTLSYNKLNLESEIQRLQGVRDTAQQRLTNIINTPLSRNATPEQVISRIDSQTRAQNALAASSNALVKLQADLVKVENELTRAMSAPALTNQDNRLKRLASRARADFNQIGAEVVAARAATRAAAISAPEIYPGYNNIPTDVQRQLQRSIGLGAGKGTLIENLTKQNATFDTPIRDLERGLTTFSGTMDRVVRIKDQDIVTNQRWRVSMDDNGKVVETMGRNLRGLSRITEQISRDFQKVIEWTVATTVVFGGLAAAGQALGVIKDLDANLTRLSVTANTTSTQTKVLYKDLLNVANITATPLDELVKSADDLALAVKRPGQTTQELTADIISLGEAVGIYTNITGADTVSATEQLVAVMKQLGITASGVVDVLNKVTAAAGGQSTTIADITKALAVMAESGKTANLTLDQQIGIIKTLSQVTSKSPAEIATSFKNLVGALENPAAIKALKKYNIALISEGNSIIGIYSQIAQKVRTGDIAQGDLSGLLRAISGGPRRAPDAAALLANIDQVLQETTVSANATNEAFMANARIVDTLQAKFTQFQNVLKDKVFTQFGQVFKDVVVGGIPIITQLLSVISQIPPQVITIATEFLVMSTAIRFAQRAVLALGITDMVRGSLSSVKNLVSSFGALRTAINEASAAAATGNLSNYLGLRLAGAGKLAGKAGLAALIGGGVGALGAAASGGGFNQIAGTGLQGAGLGLMSVPSPYFITQIVGGLALLGGTFLSLQQDAKSATDAMKENAQAIETAASSATSAQQQLNTLGEAQKNLAKEIENYEKTPANKRSATDQSTLNDLYNQYAQNIMSAADAQRQLNQAVEDFGKATENLQVSEQVRAALANINSPEAQKIIKEAQLTILKQSVPNLQTGDEIRQWVLSGKSASVTPMPTPEGKPFDYTIQRFVTNAQEILAAAKGGKFISPTYAYRQTPITDMAQFVQNQDNLKSMFDDTGKFTANIDLTAKNLDLIRNAINQLPDDWKAKLSPGFEAWAGANDDITKAAQAIEYYVAAAKSLQATGAAKPAEQINAITSQFSNYAIEAGNAGIPKDVITGNLNRVFADLNTIYSSRRTLPSGEVTALAKMIADIEIKQQGVNVSTEQYNALVAGIAQKIMPEWADGLDTVKGKMDGISEETAKVFEDMTKSLDDFVTSMAEKSMSLFADFRGGNISAADYSKQVAQLNSLAGAAIKVRDALNSVEGDQFKATFDQMIQSSAASLSKLPGWIDASNMSMQDFINRAFQMAEAMNLSGEQAVKFGEKITNLINAVKKIAELRTTYHIDASVNVSQAIAALKALRATIMAMTLGEGATPGQMLAYSNAQGQLAAINAAISALSSAQGAFDTSLTGVTSTLGSGAGTSSGGGKKPSGPNVSTLDLPDAIANATNRASLIQQAIANAKALQAKIPGATKEAKNDIVELLKGTQRILEVRGIKDDYLRKALEELNATITKQNELLQKADMISRIRVGAGDFAAIANVPLNSQSGVSNGGSSINVNLNINGQVLTPAQLDQIAAKIIAGMKLQATQ